jgi:hypothetical protein
MIFTCPQCKIEYKGYPSRKRVYCSVLCHSRSKLGKVSPWKGKKHSEVVRRKISLALTGNVPWNKGMKFPMKSWSKRVCIFCNEEFEKMNSSDVKYCSHKCYWADMKTWSCEKHSCWKGDDVGYQGLHTWVTKTYGKPPLCESCGSDYIVQWSNKSGNYIRKRDDWQRLCIKCHRKYDNFSLKMKQSWERRRLCINM